MDLGICGLQNGQSHMLTLSDCHPVKYTCNNGQCIDLSNKCDGLIDCADGTDELECEFLVLDKNYSKNKLPLIQKDEPVKVYFRRVMLVCHKNKWCDLWRKPVTCLFLFFEREQENVVIGGFFFWPIRMFSFLTFPDCF